MLKAVLFDLDNTLILFEEVKFVSGYYPRMAARFEGVFPDGQFAERLMKATVELRNNDGSRINRELFIATLCDGLNVNREEVWTRFEQFFSLDFDVFRDTVIATPGADNVFRHVKERKLKLVVATNPIWPLDVQRKRISWAGLSGAEVDLITHIDNMSYCKPQLGYFRQICRLIDVQPDECLMVGDDPANDMVAAKIGMKTYQTTDSRAHSKQPLEVSKTVIGNNLEGIPPADFSGPLTEVPPAIDNLLGL
ncbi:MAG: HAD family hydrolase [Dehalococcoidia bacterium]|nr:HAD family hydrolase [Dehalococcoidia bacterium]MDD5647847.1 HAD family hydrolase [Dehalococcoidia bacterium]